MRAFLCGMVVAWAISSGLTETGVQASPPQDNAELKTLFDQDQADRQTSGGLDELRARARRDEERLARVKELYVAGIPETGADWFHAALVLQHAQEAEDILLAHEMALASLAAGDPRAKWLAAATEDRFLRRIGRPQRFGTQYESAGGPLTLAETEAGVTDHLRNALSVPPLPEPGSEFGKQ